MKKLVILTIAVLLSGINFNSTAQSKKTDAFTVKVDGLGCPFCAYGLEKKFKELKGIKNIKIEMETGIMTFNYPAEENLSVEQVNKQVEKAGYTPVNILIKRADGTEENSEKSTKKANLDEGNIMQKSFYVAGNCDMCKARIEKAAKSVEGVSEAIWNKETKMILVKYNSDLSSLINIYAAISQAGHDTKWQKSKDEVYENLPACCLYERIK